MQKVLSTLRKAVQQFNLIEDGDRIAVGVSGGKDSLVLLKALCDFKKFKLFDYDIVAVLVDIYSGKVDYSQIENFCKENNVELVIEKTDINDIIFNVRKEKNPCSLCAKMRRGVLNSLCIKLGCNKLALGHHMQDVITTFFMSLFYEGRIFTMMPISYMSKTGITLIRPLYLTEEFKIVNASLNFPILKSQCPANYDSKRKEIKELVEKLKKEIPDSKKRIENAILNPESNLLLASTIKEFTKNKK